MSKIDPKHISNLMATDADLTNKVDKIAGKGLSTEDYTSTEKSKLGGIATGATANDTDANLLNRTNHTGTQLAATISNFSAATLAVLAAGLSTVTSSTVLVGDSIIQALGKLQAQINTLTTSKYDASNPNSYETTTQLNARDTNNRARANHTGTQVATTISDFNNAAISATLTGLSNVANGVITASDSIVIALGKLQGAFTDHNGQAGTTHPDATSSSNGFLTAADKIKLDRNQTLKLGNAVNNTSNSTYVSLTGLSIPVINGKTYRFSYYINFTSAATNTGITIGILNTNAAGTLTAKAEIPISSTAGTANKFSGPLVNFSTTVTSTGVGATGTPYCAEVIGTFTCTTSGSIYPRFRSETNGQQISVQANSTVQWEEI